jgi:hypothetical protein
MKPEDPTVDAARARPALEDLLERAPRVRRGSGVELGRRTRHPARSSVEFQGGLRGRWAMTFALRRCCACRRTLGIGLWPWMGRWVVMTHGLCTDCSPDMEAEWGDGPDAAGRLGPR